MIPQFSEILSAQIEVMLVVLAVDVTPTTGAASNEVLNVLTVLEALKLFMVFGIVALLEMGWNGLPGLKEKVLLQQFSLVLNPPQKSLL